MNLRIHWSWWECSFKETLSHQLSYSFPSSVIDELFQTTSDMLSHYKMKLVNKGHIVGRISKEKFDYTAMHEIQTLCFSCLCFWEDRIFRINLLTACVQTDFFFFTQALVKTRFCLILWKLKNVWQIFCWCTSSSPVNPIKSLPCTCSFCSDCPFPWTV